MQLTGATGNLLITGTLTQASSADFKKDIRFLDERELDQALQTVTATPVATYRYKTMPDESRLIYGVIAEQTPPALLAEDNKGVNLSTTIGLLLAAVKAQQTQIEQLKARIMQLENGR
jgi:hypothetical protein